MANDQTSKVSRCRDKGISKKTLRRAPLLFLIAVLLLPVISQASAQEALAAGNLTAGTQAASAKTPVPYVDSAGKAHECTEYTNTSALGSGEWTLRAGWYVLDQSATNSSGIRVTGDVNLILCDGNTLNTTRVLVDDDNILRIWAQKNGTGKLKATGVKNYAGIGSGEGRSCGYVVINGGSIEAHGGTNGAGIGGGKKGGGGSVTINGGTVSAYGAESDAWFAASGAAGIGGGRDGRGDTVQIRGGKVYAKGAEAAAGIGGGCDGHCTTITISGGEVTATGGSNGAGIKPGIIIIILAVMAYALASPFLHANTLRRKVEYVITNQRLITIKDEAKGVEFDKIKTAEIKTDADGHTTLLCGPASVKTESDKWRTDATLGLRLDNDSLDCNGLTWYAIPNAKEAEALLKKYLPL